MRGWLSIRGSTLAFAINQSVGVLHLSPLHYTATAHKYSDFQYLGLLYCFRTQVFRLSVFRFIIQLRRTSIQPFSIDILLRHTSIQPFSIQG